MTKLAMLSETIGVDVHDTGELHEALATCSAELVRALDADRIHFERDTDMAMLAGLLALALMTVVGDTFGKPATLQ